MRDQIDQGVLQSGSVESFVSGLLKEAQSGERLTSWRILSSLSWISFTTSLLLSCGCVCSWQKYVWVDFLPITEPDPIRSWKTPSDPALDACILEICIPDVLLLTFLQVFLKLRLITTYLWTLEGYFDDSVVPAGNRRLCDPVVKSGSCCGFDNQLDSMTFINAGIFKKHCQLLDQGKKAVAAGIFYLNGEMERNFL